MSSSRSLPLTLLTALASAFATSAFATVPYTEHFTTDAANWVDGSGVNIAAWVSSGGIAPGSPDTGYITSSKDPFGFTNPQNPPVVFAGLDNLYDSSGDQFSGNWLTSGINHFSTYVWHDAPSSLSFFVRFAGPANTPGTIGLVFAPVPQNTWTKLDFDIVPGNVNSGSNPSGQFLEEGPGSFTAAFSNVGNIQVGFFPTQAMASAHAEYHFALDQPSTSTPEPASWLLALGAAAAAWSRRRRVVGV